MLLLDAPVRVGGSSAYRDHLDPRLFHVLPAPPSLVAVERQGRFWRLFVEAHPVSELAGRTGTPGGRACVPLHAEEAHCRLLRFEVRRRRTDPDTHFLVLRTLLTAEAAATDPGLAILEGELSPPDAEILETTLASAGPLLLVAVISASGIEAPARITAEIDLRAARARLGERHPLSALVTASVYEDCLEQLRGEARLAVESEDEEARTEAYLSRWLGSALFDPAPSPDALAPSVRAELGAVAQGFGVVGRMFRDAARLPEGSSRLQGRGGLLRAERFAFVSSLDGLAALQREGLRRPLVDVPSGADWSGIERLEVETRGRNGGTARFELSARAPARELPTHDLPELRARAVLEPGEVILEAPDWTPWRPAARARAFEPQRVAGRRPLGAALAWMDPTRFVSAQVELRGPDGACALDLDAHQPERQLAVVGSATEMSTRLHQGPGVFHESERALKRPASRVMVSAPEPVLVRLSDPTHRHRSVEVEIGAEGCPSRSFRLSRAAPEAVWDPGPRLPERGYRWRSSVQLEDGRTLRIPWTMSRTALLEIGDPHVELRTLELEAPRARAPEGAWLLVEAEEPPPRVASRVEVFVEAGALATVEVPFKVGAPLAYHLLGERYGVPEAERSVSARVVRARRWVLD